MSGNWRLIPLSERTGAEQMAIDSWLLDQHTKGLQPSILRFYTWAKPTISLGYHQREFSTHWNALSHSEQPVDLVRRPTGGRAVLHQGDLTYAIVTSVSKGVSRRATYERLCQFLIAGWQRLGVSLNFGTAGRGYIKNPNCFGTATAADLVTPEGYKLIGSAQVYRGNSVLQHGSMRIRPDTSLHKQVFEEELLLPQTVLDLKALEMGAIAHSLTQAAQHHFETTFEVESLSSDEIAQIQELSNLRR